MAREHPETISPTAHYTGYVWFAHGLSNEAFATPQGKVMYHTLRATTVIAETAGWPSLEGMLLARHRLIDLRLTELIDSGRVSQVIEVAAGLSPRGWRFRKKYGARIRYLEADLPAMIAHKRSILAELGAGADDTVEIDALADTGPTSIDAICATLDPAQGTAIVTEGLVNYFDEPTLLAMWRRFAAALARFPVGFYLSDLMLREHNAGALVAGFSQMLSMFVRGKVHVHFDSVDAAERALADCGLSGVLLDPRDFAPALPGLELAGAARVRIIEAMVES